MEITEQDKQILEEVNKERFKRRLSLFRSISTRVIAILLIIAIVWVGYAQISYAKDVNAIKEKYGAAGYCYLCGKETLRACECQYIPQLFEEGFNRTELALRTAENNILPCPDKNSRVYKTELENKINNLTLINSST